MLELYNQDDFEAIIERSKLIRYAHVVRDLPWVIQALIEVSFELDQMTVEFREMSKANAILQAKLEEYRVKDAGLSLPILPASA